MNQITNDLVGLINNDFESELAAILPQLPATPPDATPEQIIRHAGAILHRLAFMKGVAVGVEASQVYVR